MLIYEGTKAEFMKSIENDTISIEIEKKILERMYRHTPLKESRSWDNSLRYMYIVMNDMDIPEDAGIAIEYNIPRTAMRVDFIITGRDAQEKPNAILIELKQWDKLKLVSDKDGLVKTVLNRIEKEVPHPSYQVLTYCWLLRDNNEMIQNGELNLVPCAYLHNYMRQEMEPLTDGHYSQYLGQAPVFTKGGIHDFREFIKNHIKYGDNKEILYLLGNSRNSPPKSLQDEVRSMMQGTEEFYMIDGQKVVYEAALKYAFLAQKEKRKKVFIIKGGPGTGKSVVAVKLLAELISRGQSCEYISKTSAPRNVYLAKLKGVKGKLNIKGLFKGSGSYVDYPKDSLDTAIVDEAHRLSEKSGMFNNKGENQIKEIIDAAKCSIFFIDERQRVHINDKGSVEEIKKWARNADAKIYLAELVSQFRCNGSDGYLAWLDYVLQIRDTANLTLDNIDYDFVVEEDPDIVREFILKENRINNRSRMLAGYCWNWPKKYQNDADYKDICIGSFGMSWNLGNTKTFAIDENSVNEVGCIHTSQGLEFDYVGVIIGNDMRYENGTVITDFTKRASTDQSLKGIKKLYKKNPQEALSVADEIIKNTYRTLLTRGMKGCHVYCTDPGLRNYLKEMLERSHG